MADLWTNVNGRTVCREHGGYALQANLSAYPRRTRHTTDLTVWSKVTPADVTDWEEVRAGYIKDSGVDLGPLACEDCGATP